MLNRSKKSSNISYRISKYKPVSNPVVEKFFCSQIFSGSFVQQFPTEQEHELWIHINAPTNMSTSVEHGSYGGYPVFIRDHNCRPTVRSLALSEIFYPLEDERVNSTSRSRSACPPIVADRRSCFLFNENPPCSVAPPVRSVSHLSAPPLHRDKIKKSVDPSSDTSLLHKLQALFHIKTSSGKQKVKKTATQTAAAQKPPQPPLACRPPPHIPPPLINFGPVAQLRSRSQSAFRSQRSGKTQSDVFTPQKLAHQPQSVVYLVPVTCVSSSICGGGVSSFTPSRPSSLALNTAQRLRRPLLFGPLASVHQTAAQRKEEIRQKHYSAHLPGEVLQLPSQTSHGLWSARSATSLGIAPPPFHPLPHHVDNVSPYSSVFNELQTRRRRDMLDSSWNNLSTSSPSSSSTYPSSSSTSNDSAVELLAFPSTTTPNAINSVVGVNRTRSMHGIQSSGSDYSTIEGLYSTPPRYRPGAGNDDDDDEDYQLCEKTPTAHSPTPAPPIRRLFSSSNTARIRSESTATLTSCDDEENSLYAVPSTYISTINHRMRSPLAPTVPPRSTDNCDDEDAPLLLPPPLKAMYHYAEPKARTIDGIYPPQRIRTPSDMGYHRSPIFNSQLSSGSCASSKSQRANTPSAASAHERNGSNCSNWWSDILPYKPNTLPDNLVDRLRQRNSLALSRLNVNASENISSEGRNLMTRSLYEPRMPSVEPDCETETAVDNPQQAALAPERKRSLRLRPVSYHDTCRFIPSTNLPSLKHLLSQSISRIPSPSIELPPPPNSQPSIVSPILQDFLQPVDSPLLGQYGRLKLLKGADVDQSSLFKP